MCDVFLCDLHGWRQGAAATFGFEGFAVPLFVRHGRDDDGRSAEDSEFMERISSSADREVGIEQEVIEVIDVPMYPELLVGFRSFDGIFQFFIMQESSTENEVDADIVVVQECSADVREPSCEFDGCAVEVDAAHGDDNAPDVVADGLFVLAVRLELFRECEILCASIDGRVRLVVPIIRIHHRIDDDVTGERPMTEFIDANDFGVLAAKSVNHAVCNGAEIEDEHVRSVQAFRHDDCAIHSLIRSESEGDAFLESRRTVLVDEKRGFPSFFLAGVYEVDAFHEMARGDLLVRFREDPHAAHRF